MSAPGGGAVAGKLSVEVVSDLRGFAADLRKKIEAASKDVKAQVGVEIADDDLRGRLSRLVKEAGADQKATVGTDLDSRGLREKLTAVTEEAGADENVKLGTDLDAKTLPVKARAAKEEAQKAAGSIAIPVKIDSKSFGKLAGGLKLLLLPTIVAAVGPAVTLIGDLGSALFALGSAIAPAANLIGTLPGLLGVLVQGFAVTKIATSGVGDAFKQVASAQAQLQSGQKLTEAQVKKLAAALENVSPAARTLVEDVTRLRPAFTQLRLQVQQAFFAPFVNQVTGLAQKYLPLLRTQLTQTAGILGRTVASVGKLAASPGFSGRFAQVLGSNNKALTSFTRAVAPLIDGLVALAAAAGPIINVFARDFADAAVGARNFLVAGQETGRLAATFQRAYDVLSKVVGILVAFGKGIANMGRVANQVLGGQLLQNLAVLGNRFQAFTASAEGKNKIAAYFEGMKPALHEIALLFDAIAGGLGKLGQDQSLVPLLAQIRTQLGPALSQIFQNIKGDFLSSLVSAATALANLGAALTQAGGGGLTAFLGTLTLFINAVTAIVNNVPGASTALTIFFAAAGTAKAVTGVAGIVTGMGKSIIGVGSASIGATRQLAGFVTGLRGIPTVARENQAAGVKFGQTLRSGIGEGIKVASSGISAFTGLLSTNFAKVGQLASKAAEFARGTRIAAAATRIWAAATFLLDGAMAILTSPIFLIVAAIALLVGAVVYAYFHFETFRRIVDSVWAAIRTAVTTAVGFIVPYITASFSALVGFLSGVWSAISGAVQAAWSGIAGFFSAVWARIRSIFTAGVAVFNTIVTFLAPVIGIVRAYINLLVAIFQLGWQIIRLVVLVAALAVYEAVRASLAITMATVRTAMSVISAVFSAVWGFIVGVFRAALAASSAITSASMGVIRAVVSTVMGAIRATISAVMGVIRAVFSAGWNAARAVVSAAMGVIRGVVSAGMGAVRAVVSAVTGAISAVWRAFWGSTLGGAVRSGINGVLGAVRALARIVGIAAQYAAGFVRALASGLGQAAGAVARGVSSAVGAVASGAGRMFSAGVSLIQNLINGITSKIREVTGLVSGLADKVKGFFGGSPVEHGPLLGWNNGGAGKNLMNLLAAGFKAGGPAVAAEAARVAKLVQTIFASKQANSNLRRIGQTTVSAFLAGVKRAVPAAAATVTKLTKGLTAKQRASKIGALRPGSGKYFADVQAETVFYSRLSSTRNSAVRLLAAANEKLKAVQDQYNGILTSVADNVLQGANIVGQSSADTAISFLADKLKKAQEFTANIAALAKRGLRSDVIQDLVSGGVEQAGSTAAALAKASAAQIAQINSLQGQLVTAAGKAAKTSADILYGAGLAAAQGLVNGLKAKQAELTKQMQAIAALMAASIKKALGIRSPSRVFAGIGGDVGAGLIQGLLGKSRAVVGAVTDLSGILASASGTLTPAVAGFGGLAVPAPVAAGSAAATAVSIVVNPARGQSEEEIAALVARRLGRAIS